MRERGLFEGGGLFAKIRAYSRGGGGGFCKGGGLFEH